MSLESIFKLSVLINLVDHMTGPMGGVNQVVDQVLSKLEKLNKQFKGFAQAGAGIATAGVALTKAAIDPVESTYDSQKAFGELRSVGIKDMKAIEDAAVAFSNTYSGTVKPEFIAAAYDIKSGISSLSDTAVGGYTYMAALTAKATKSTVGEMTNLFATGYGIYKSYYRDMTDLEFSEIFSAGIAKSVQQFKTTGTEMQQSISTLGKSATNANVPLEEQFSILGMLQQTMSGSEAGTKYRAFLKSVTKAGKELGLTFIDANNQLLSMPEILTVLKNRYGETLDAVEKLELQKAFGTEEAVALIDLLYPKIGELEDNVLSLYDALGQGKGVAEQMAAVMNDDPGSEKTIKGQAWHNLKEQMGGALQPTMTVFNDMMLDAILNMQTWVDEHPKATAALMNLMLALGVTLSVLGTFVALVGVGGVAVTSFMKYLPMLGRGLGLLQGGAKAAIFGIRGLARGLITMTYQGIAAGVRALPGLIVSVWSFTAALLANPVTWIVVGIIALVAALYLLWKHFDTVSAFASGAWAKAVGLFGTGFNWIQNQLMGVPDSVLIALAAFMPWLGIPLLMIKHWDGIKGWFGGLWTEMTTDFDGFISSLPERILSKLGEFKDSGMKVMQTFGEGIKAGASSAVDSMKGGLTNIRKMLPFSDAKEGPLSQLTLSGKKVFETLASGMKLGTPSVINQTEFAFAGIAESMATQVPQVYPDVESIQASPVSVTTQYPVPEVSFDSQKMMDTILASTKLAEPNIIDLDPFAFTGAFDVMEKEAPKVSEQKRPVPRVNLREIITQIKETETRTEVTRDSGKTVENHYHFEFENVEDVQTIIDAYARLKDDTESNDDDGGVQS